VKVAGTTRREFVQQTALSAAALCARPLEALAAARRAFEEQQQNAAALDAAAVRKFSSQVAGHVITPETPDYDSARLMFNRAFDKHRALIVRCAGATDVACSLEFAQSQNLPLAVHAGGHNRAGFSVCDGGVVIDLSGMNHVNVDSQKHVREQRRAQWCAT